MRSKSESKMQEIIEYVNHRYFQDGAVPSLQEISDAVKMAKSSVSRYLSAMETKGLIAKSGAYYGLQTNAMRKVTNGLRRLPVVGDVACGTPILAEQNVESYLTLSGNILGSGDFFVLKAKGDSMINIGIEDGDYVIIRRQESADDGQIVVALVNDGDCTLKRFFKDTKTKTYRLHPENDAMQDMLFDRVDIQGVAIKVLKDIRL